jgi:hypothetical protein
MNGNRNLQEGNRQVFGSSSLTIIEAGVRGTEIREQGSEIRDQGTGIREQGLGNSARKSIFQVVVC